MNSGASGAAQGQAARYVGLDGDLQTRHKLTVTPYDSRKTHRGAGS